MPWQYPLPPPDLVFSLHLTSSSPSSASTAQSASQASCQWGSALRDSRLCLGLVCLPRIGLPSSLPFRVRTAESELLVTLDGWDRSKGARLEVHVANELGIKVMDYKALRSWETA